MKVNGSSGIIYVGAGFEKKDDAKKRMGESVVFAGNLELTSDTIEAKRREAREKAFKVVGEAFDSDKIIDDELKNRREHLRKLQGELGVAQGEINRLNQSKEDLRNSMGIAADSEEQKDLELLEKRENAIKNGTYFELSDEELDRLKKIDENGLTEYQEQALEINKAKSFYEKQVKDINDGIKEETMTIQAIKQEMVKNTGMIEAEEQADEIMESAGDEIRGMLLDEVKEKIDEEAKENEEEAEKLAEAKKEKEEQEDRLRLNDEELLKNAMKTDAVKEELDVKQKVKNILDDAKLTVDDIAGVAVDASI